mmetsp:Transcript_67374/g.170975  ORF Transcript_67374/g.170975 Transcript_67374/m.170975 type:complete len:393 (-) Transcript_67374:24-1202(-)
MPSRVVYVGSGAVGQAKVSNSPVFGKLAVPTEERAAIVSLTVDEERGTLAVLRVEEQPFHVGWLVPHPLNGHLYGVGGGKAHSWAVGSDGSLTLTSSSDTAGGSAFLELSCDGRWALSASYGAGTLAVLPISPNGALGMATCVKMHSLRLNPTLADRQEGCHPHQIRLDPHTNKWALSCDLGASRVWVYSFDSVTGTLVGEADSPRHLLLPESAGPRHLDFHPSGRWVYILCELDGCLVVCDWDAEVGKLSPKQTLCALAEGIACSRAHHSGNAHVAVSTDGGVVFVSSRTDNVLNRFAVDLTDGTLRRCPGEHASTRGVCPRNFSLEESTSYGAVVRVLNQDSQNVVSFPMAHDWSDHVGEAVVLELLGVCPVVITAPVVLPTSGGSVADC